MVPAGLLSPVEIACGLALGGEPGRRLRRDGPSDPATALERAVLPALARGRCLVSFSGGLDSSLVLAAATRVARREGLPDPVPITNRFPGVALADEARWQELVVGHLRLADWQRLEHGDELDAVGPVARRVLRRHGLLWPFNAHFHVPLLERARGGSLLTGIGGDELLAAVEPSRPGQLLAARARPVPRDAVRLAFALSPPALRVAVRARREPAPFEWLTELGRRAVTAAVAASSAPEPVRMGPRLRYGRARRALRVGTASLDRLARAEGGRIEHPLLDDGVWHALGVALGPRGAAERSVALRRAFPGLLPEALLARRGKASFDAAFFHRHSRALAEDWAGGGVPDALVDPRALRRHWAGARPRAQSFTLLQAAWLAGSGREERGDPAGVVLQAVQDGGAAHAPDR